MAQSIKTPTEKAIAINYFKWAHLM